MSRPAGNWIDGPYRPRQDIGDKKGNINNFISLSQCAALFEREQLILQISESLGERDGHYADDSEAELRVAEIGETPEEATVSREEFMLFIQSRRSQRRSGKK